MPVAPLDSLELALNTARVRLLDAIEGLSGDILTDGAPFTLTYVNAAWRRFQESLVNYGVTWFKPETILPNLPLVANGDPGSQVRLDWTGYFDGAAVQGNPFLPQDFITPLILWERASGSNGSFFPMDRLDNGIPAVPKEIGRAHV